MPNTTSYAGRAVSTTGETFNKLTVSFWFKGMADPATSTQRSIWGLNDNSDSNRFFNLYFSSNGSLYGYWKQNEGLFFTLGTMQKFRDPNAWTHFLMVMDTTLGTAADRVKYYINGERITVFEDSLDTITQNASSNILINTDGRMWWGGAKTSGTFHYYDGSLSHCHMCVGYAYQADSFGETDATTGQWKIKTSPSVSYGTNGGFWFKDGNQFTDSSSNGNTLSTTSGSVTKTEDNPSNVFATLNALVNTSGDTNSLSNGNNTYTNQNYSYNTRSTLGMTSGKFYWEMKVNNASAVKVGVCTSQYDPSLDTDSSTAHYGGAGGGGVYVLMSNSTTTWQSTFSDTSKATGSYTNAIASTSSSILMGAVDVDANKLWVGVDGVWMNSGNPATGANAQITFTNSSPDALHIMASHGDDSTQRSTKFNFGNGYFGTTAVSSAGINASGNGIFEYDVPTGFTALSTKGLNL